MKKAVLLIFAVVFSVSTPGLFAQPPNVTLNVQFMDSWAVYTMADWEDNDNLYTITITNQETNSVRWIFLEMEVFVSGCADPSMPDGRIGWGVTYPNEMEATGSIIYRNNQDFKYNQIQYDEFNDDFEDAVMNTGSTLPAGTYEYRFRLLYDDNTPPNYTQAIEIPNAVSSDQIIITMPNDPELVSPGEATEEGFPIYESNPTFQWLSTGAHAGSRIYFRMIVCNKEEGQSNDEAIQNLPFYEKEWEDLLAFGQNPPWIVEETGFATTLTFTYPSSEENFYNGKYVWQVFARSERNLTNPSAGFFGESEIFCFQYGDIPQPVYPPCGSEITDRNPSFTWTMALGAQGYQVRISGEDDPLVENNYMEEDVSATFIDHVPGEEPLTPGNIYYWKVRAMPFGYWCEPCILVCVEPVAIEGEAPEMTVIINPMDPTHPTFIWDLVNGASYYRLFVGDSPDISAYFWSDEPVLTSLIYPESAPPLELGVSYFAWVQPMDADDEPLGEPSVPTPFDIPEEMLGAPTIVNLISPVDISVYTINPVFTWDPVRDAGYYEICLYSDPDLSDLIWSSDPMGTSLEYPESAEPLEFGNAYWWQVGAFDNQGEALGELSHPASFDIISVIPNLIYPVDEQVEDLNPNFSWDPIEGVNNFRIEVAADKMFSEILWNSDEIVSNSVTYPSSGVPELSYNLTYWWRVTALNPQGGALGETSPPANFSTPPGEFQIEIIFSP